MARPSSKDPLDKFRFSVSIDGFTRLGFTTVDSPSFTITTKSYIEGGAHLFPKKIVDEIKYAPVIMQRGQTGDSSFLSWAKSIYNPVLGVEIQNNVSEYRKNVTINQLDRAGRPVITYTLFNAIPVEYKPASDFDAAGDDTFSIEKLVLEYESFEVKIASQNNNPFSIQDVSKRLFRNLF